MKQMSSCRDALKSSTTQNSKEAQKNIEIK